MSDGNDKKWVIILDMQPIDPPIGGGRIRLLGLYHHLGKNFDAQYIGTYDWPGEGFRDHQLSESLREVDIPLSNEHFAKCRQLEERVDGKTIIDSTFSQLAYLSPQYVEYARAQVAKADVVIFSHPWVYPLVKDLLRRDTQLIIYDSQNVEGYLRYTLLNDGGFGTDIVKSVIKNEFELCHMADLVLACSYEDKRLFNRLYGVPLNKINIVPNGVFSERIRPFTQEEKIKIKRNLGLGTHSTAFFIGSNYAPNREACDFIIKELAPQLPETTFIIAGGVGESIHNNKADNVIITGRLSEEDKLLYLSASDLAINPIFSGSGTNIKMFDFMAAGLPVISTVIGSRGITAEDYAGIVIRDRFNFISSIERLINNKNEIWQMGAENRKLVKKNYSWELISPKLGDLIMKKVKSKRALNDSSLPTKTNHRFALMSSWNLRCGIAEHSRYLANEFDKTNADYLIIANTNTELTSLYLLDDISRDIYPLWYYDYINWRDSKIDISGVIETLLLNRIKKFNIQYHTGFFNRQVLLELVKACVEVDIEVIITLHNSREIASEILQELNDLGIKLIVHTLDEKNTLESQKIRNVCQIPLGVLDYPDEDKIKCRNELGILGNPIIGSFGFLRPHKGVLEAIEAVGFLRDQYPDIKFLGVNALYPSEDSELYLKKCLERIDELQLNDNVTLLTSFLEMDQVIHYLHASDLIILPYYESKEGSSAAANTAVSAKRPLVISDSQIFRLINSVGHMIGSIDPHEIASEIHLLLSNPSLLEDLKTSAKNYVKTISYANVAEKYLDILEEDEKLDYESLLQDYYESFLKPGDYAIDIGAHVGRHTIPIAKKVAPNGRVFAYEPIYTCREKLIKSIKHDENNLEEVITTYPYALSDRKGNSEFTIFIDDPGYSGLKARSGANTSKTERIVVDVRTLDDHLAGLKSLEYIKIDAEGGEFDILKGGVNLIKKFRPVVTFEFGESSYSVYGVIPENVFRFWKELNYRIFDILGREILDEATFVRSSIDQIVWDYIAIPNESELATKNIFK